MTEHRDRKVTSKSAEKNPRAEESTYSECMLARVIAKLSVSVESHDPTVEIEEQEEKPKARKTSKRAKPAT